ncbi:MAG: hypothetical protein WAX07_07355 [Candidatus Altiarchaeia archaeon]
MAVVNVRLKVPAGYEREVRRFVEEFELEDLVRKSFKRCVEVELKKKLLKDIASRSSLSPKDASSLSEETKMGWAAKHSS